MTKLLLFLALAAMLAAPANALPCDDGNPCTIAAADGPCAGGDCISCDDGNACTAAPRAQLPVVQLVEAPPAGMSCDDGNACTACTASLRPAPPDQALLPPRMVAKRKSCDDGNACSTARQVSASAPVLRLRC